MSAVIIASGSDIEKHVFEEENINVEYVICADGGLEKAEKLNLIPNIVVGDLDSVSPDILKHYLNKNVELIKYPVEKDFTDMEIAIEYAISKNYKDIILVGATGTRLDHTMGNILLLEKYFLNGIKIKILDNNNIIQIMGNILQLKHKKNYYVSIIPVTETIEGVSLKGFKYPLHNVTIKRGSTLCISNEIMDDLGIITIEKGNALVFMSKD
ncbi:MAG: thiN [Bacillota bacterium]|nr:thiN [Bacillota bacterium]